MTQQYDNTNRGVLFQNKRKESDSHPDFSGTINIDGKEFWLSGWKKRTKDNDPMFSLSVKAKDPAKNVAAALKQVRTAKPQRDDDLDW